MMFKLSHTNPYPGSEPVSSTPTMYHLLSQSISRAAKPGGTYRSWVSKMVRTAHGYEVPMRMCGSVPEHGFGPTIDPLRLLG